VRPLLPSAGPIGPSKKRASVACRPRVQTVATSARSPPEARLAAFRARNAPMWPHRTAISRFCRDSSLIPSSLMAALMGRVGVGRLDFADPFGLWQQHGRYPGGEAVAALRVVAPRSNSRPAATYATL
jgi:hypothetical protein